MERYSIGAVDFRVGFFPGRRSQLNAGDTGAGLGHAPLFSPKSSWDSTPTWGMLEVGIGPTGARSLRL